jgi:hypothetical protein
MKKDYPQIGPIRQIIKKLTQRRQGAKAQRKKREQLIALRLGFLGVFA